MARDSVKLPFGSDEHELRGKHVFRTAREIEPIITVTEIAIMAQRGGLPYAAIADAYAVALKKAGTKADPEDVFEWLYEGVGEAQNVFRAMEKLAEILVPASARKVIERTAKPETGGSEADPT